MLSKQEIEKKFLESIWENDPQKDAKILEIKSWYLSYQFILETYATNLESIDLFLKVLKECWNENKIDRREVGRKLLKLEIKCAGDSEDKLYIINDFDRYRIACWCCLEEEAKSLFNKFKNASFEKEASKIDIEYFVKGLRSGPLMIFWSHNFGGMEVKTKSNDKNIYEYGFECAMAEKRVEALSFFWDKLPEEKKNPKTLIQVALYDSFKGSANVDMIEFCLNNLSKDKYLDLLEADFGKNEYYSVLSKLISGHSIQNAKLLFDFLKPENITPEIYTDYLMYGLLRSTISLPYSDLVKYHNDLIIHILNCDNFKEHRLRFFEDLCREFSPFREDMNHLAKIGRPDAVFKILDLVEPDQLKSIMKFKDCDDLIKKYSELGSNELNRNEASKSKNIERLIQTTSTFTDKKEYSTENISSGSQFKMQQDDEADFLIEKGSSDFS